MLFCLAIRKIDQNYLKRGLKLKKDALSFIKKAKSTYIKEKLITHKKKITKNIGNLYS